MSLQPDLPEEVIALAATAEAPRPHGAPLAAATRAWRELQHAPLTAWFGLIVIALYVFAAIFAPLIAPYGEAEIVGDAYEPWGDAVPARHRPARPRHAVAPDLSAPATPSASPS